MTVKLVDGDFPDEWTHAALGSRILGMDIETNGLDYSVSKIATVQMYIPTKGTIMIRNMPVQPINLIRVLENKQTTKIFHHAPFDLGFLVNTYDLYPEKIACTKVAAKILDPKRQMFFDPDTNKGSHSLKALAHTMFGFYMDKKLAVSDWFADELSDAQIEYAAKDVEFLPDMLAWLERSLSKAGKLKIARDAMKHLGTKAVLQVKNYDDVYGY